MRSRKAFLSYKNIVRWALLLSMGILVLTTSSCLDKKSNKKSNEPNKKASQIITIDPSVMKKNLYFSGTIEPLSVIPVVSPATGIVKQKFFNYGYFVNKGALLLTIKSENAEQAYKTALVNYLQEKQQRNESLQTESLKAKLYAQGVISKNEYDQARTNHFLEHIKFLQTKLDLEKNLESNDVAKLEKLSISDMKGVQKVLSDNMQQLIKITAEHTGIILFPKDKRLIVGSVVKLNDTLLELSNLDGISIVIKVDELNINQLQQDQQAVITSDAFPGIALKGELNDIEKQASTKEHLPAFYVKVVVPKLTPEQQKIIHVGMSAKVKITVQHADRILVPINAVIYKNEKNFVKVLDKHTNKIKEVMVTTGQTTLGSVVITSGLKKGDQVVVHNAVKQSK